MLHAVWPHPLLLNVIADRSEDDRMGYAVPFRVVTEVLQVMGHYRYIILSEIPSLDLCTTSQSRCMN